MISRFKSGFIFKLFISIVLLFIASNLVILDIKIFKKNPIEEKTIIYQDKEAISQAGGKKTGINTVDNLCPNSCLGKISEATESFKTLQSQIDNLSKQKQTSNNQNQQIVNTQSQVKEYFVTFGSGSSSADDWEDVTGLQVYVDSSQYGKIKSVAFEASIRIPTGNEVAYARLYNATDKHPVWFSEVSLEGGTPQLLISKPVTLDSGRKLYQVQMKTSLKYAAVLDQTRLHITTY
ncbi:MAG: hypothetical protein M1450_00390 [Patescibacteria group bacterium]|nr:hypothetical protein [Patescibacteria group bacterium]